MTTDLLAVSERESVAAAWELLARSRHRHLPVLRGQECVGLLDHATLVRATATNHTVNPRQPVGELIQRRPVKARPSEELSIVIERMQRAGADTAVVIDGRDALVGIITATDLLGALVRALQPR
jgi:CBS domain-containing membrane protein